MSPASELESRGKDGEQKRGHHKPIMLILGAVHAPPHRHRREFQPE
jgi:hypothetical protein